MGENEKDSALDAMRRLETEFVSKLSEELLVRLRTTSDIASSRASAMSNVLIATHAQHRTECGHWDQAMAGIDHYINLVSLPFIDALRELAGRHYSEEQIAVVVVGYVERALADRFDVLNIATSLAGLLREFSASMVEENSVKDRH
jgi:hypothetical protein